MFKFRGINKLIHNNCLETIKENRLNLASYNETDQNITIYRPE